MESPDRSLNCEVNGDRHPLDLYQSGIHTLLNYGWEKIQWLPVKRSPGWAGVIQWPTLQFNQSHTRQLVIIADWSQPLHKFTIIWMCRKGDCDVVVAKYNCGILVTSQRNHVCKHWFSAHPQRQKFASRGKIQQTLGIFPHLAISSSYWMLDWYETPFRGRFRSVNPTFEVVWEYSKGFSPNRILVPPLGVSSIIYLAALLISSHCMEKIAQMLQREYRFYSIMTIN